MKKTKNSDTARWLLIRCDVSSLDETEIEALTSELVYRDSVAGTAQEQENELCIYLMATAAECEEVVHYIRNFAAITATSEYIEMRNWIAESHTHWEPLTAGALTVSYCLTTDYVETPPPGTLVIHPGTGFGTGHHATTHMLLGLLQTKTVQEKNPKTILDIGTGSGILAIAASILYNTTVEAFDTDPMAIGNASVNVTLNPAARVQLATTTIETYTDSYDLVIANLYAELLIELRAEIIKRTRPGQLILVSGILEELWPAVEEAFVTNSCTCIRVLYSSKEHPGTANEKYWCAACFIRNPI